MNMFKTIKHRFAFLVLGALCSLCLAISSRADDTGLWVGTVILDRVSEITPSTDSVSQTPTPVADPLAIRIIIYINSDGGASMLRWATLMNYQTTPGDDDSIEEIIVIDEDDFYVSGVVGYTTDGNRSIGRRFSTAHYDWPDGGELAMSGDTSSGLNGTIELSATHSTNPFYHRYHNMHQDGRAVTRYIEITNLADASDSAVSSYNVLEGDYYEVINGLANTNTDTTTRDSSIIMQGTLTIVQVSSASQLGIPE